MGVGEVGRDAMDATDARDRKDDMGRGWLDPDFTAAMRSTRSGVPPATDHRVHSVHGVRPVRPVHPVRPDCRCGGSGAASAGPPAYSPMALYPLSTYRTWPVTARERSLRR